MGVVVAGRPWRAYPAPLRGVCMQSWHFHILLIGLCRLHVHASHRAEEKPHLQGGLGDRRRNHPSYTSPTTQSLSNLVDRKQVEENKKFRKTHETQVSYIQKKKKQTERFIRDA